MLVSRIARLARGSHRGPCPLIFVRRSLATPPDGRLRRPQVRNMFQRHMGAITPWDTKTFTITLADGTTLNCHIGAACTMRGDLWLVLLPGMSCSEAGPCYSANHFVNTVLAGLVRAAGAGTLHADAAPVEVTRALVNEVDAEHPQDLRRDSPLVLLLVRGGARTRGAQIAWSP